jgi:molybdate transport system substrate-binding protein
MARTHHVRILNGRFCILQRARIFAAGMLAWLMASSSMGVAGTTLVVSVGSSMKPALHEIAQTYQAVHRNTTVVLNEGGSGALQMQIQHGAPVDVFVSAARMYMDSLVHKGLVIAASRVTIAHNQLALIAHPSNRTVTSWRSLADPRTARVGLGEPRSVPAGAYARETLTQMGLWESVQRKAVFARDVSQVLTFVQTGNVDAGVVYKTDVMRGTNVRLVEVAPDESHSSIEYLAAVVSAAHEPRAANMFVVFLKSPAAQAILRRYGFLV